MRIAIVGSGNVGAGLGRAWAGRHDLVFGARDPSDPELARLCARTGASAAKIADAVRGADVVVLAVPYAALDPVLGAAGDLAGSVVVDCTNALEPGSQLVHGRTTSAAEELQKRVPRAHVFKSFNAQGAENLANPTYGGMRAASFFCGDDPRGREIVRALVGEVGFEPVDAGPLKNARLLEPLMLLWVGASRALGTRDLAFAWLRR